MVQEQQAQTIQPEAQTTEKSTSEIMPKKRFYMKWWFWLIIVLIVLGIAAYFLDLF